MEKGGGLRMGKRARVMGGGNGVGKGGGLRVGNRGGLWME